MTMRYFALTNGKDKQTPHGLVRFDTNAITTEYFSAKQQVWVLNQDLLQEVVMHKEDAYEVDEATAESIRTGRLATPVA